MCFSWKVVNFDLCKNSVTTKICWSSILCAAGEREAATAGIGCVELSSHPSALLVQVWSQVCQVSPFPSSCRPLLPGEKPVAMARLSLSHLSPLHVHLKPWGQDLPVFPCVNLLIGEHCSVFMLYSESGNCKILNFSILLCLKDLKSEEENPHEIKDFCFAIWSRFTTISLPMPELLMMASCRKD